MYWLSVAMPDESSAMPKSACEERDVVERALRAEAEARGRGEHDQESDARLGQLDESGELLARAPAARAATGTSVVTSSTNSFMNYCCFPFE